MGVIAATLAIPVSRRLRSSSRRSSRSTDDSMESVIGRGNHCGSHGVFGSKEGGTNMMTNRWRTDVAPRLRLSLVKAFSILPFFTIQFN